QRLAYVALSRSRHDAQIYTDDKDRLPQALSRDASKSSAHSVHATDQAAHYREASPRKPAHAQASVNGKSPSSSRLLPEELERGREYLARPETQAYLEARSSLQARHGASDDDVVVEARHVAVVFRQLTNGQLVPAGIPATKRVIEAATAVAKTEGGGTHQVSVPTQGVSRRSPH